MATWDFACSEPIDANVSLASGTVNVTAAPTDAVTVQIRRGRSGDPARDEADSEHISNDVTVEFADRHLVVTELPRRGLGWRGKDLHLTISMPAGSRSAIEAAEASLQSASGRIAVRHAIGDVMARTASGDIRIGTADASVTARTASGRVLVLGLARGRADLNSVSGDIEVKVVPGTGVFLDLASVTGRVTSDLVASDQGDGAELQLQCRTVSGSVHVARATAAEMAS